MSTELSALNNNSIWHWGLGKEREENVRATEGGAGKGSRNKSRRNFQEGIHDQDFFIPLTMQFGFSQKKTIGYLWETLECTVSVMKMVAEGIDKNSE